jgi:hypothetical protein
MNKSNTNISEQLTELQRQLDAIKVAIAAAEQADNRPITERVQTFEDACEILGDRHPLVRQWVYAHTEINTHTAKEDCASYADLFAYMKLRIITTALNEGWEPQFTEDEYRYYPWLYLYTEEELAKLNDEMKKRGVRFGGNAGNGAYAGLVYAYSDRAPATVLATLGSRLCFKTSELAKYAGKQFADIYIDFCLIRKN